MLRFIPGYLLIVALLISSKPASCQNRHALLIGIDKYAAPAGYVPSKEGRGQFSNLEGCRNDVLAMQSVIVSRFGFPESNIDTLLNVAATRQSILASMESLLAGSKQGDVAFIFFAGHGSFNRNSLSFEANKTDQTIVPADSWKEGVGDIRDKELNRIFNRFLDKGIGLTVIFDCCHSGSLSRGPAGMPGNMRFMPGLDWDSKDPGRDEIPELRPGNNFLIFSAAQSDQMAAEQKDEQGIFHGAFTAALLESVTQLSAGASAYSIFTTARAILKSNGRFQEPVIGGSRERRERSLFGTATTGLQDYSSVAVSGVTGSRVRLQGGYALGLHAGNELAMFNGQQDTICMLRVDTVTGVNQSEATVIKGDSKLIKAGNSFRVVNWSSSCKPLLRLYIPPSTLTESDIDICLNLAKTLKNSPVIKWQPQLGKGLPAPYATLFWRDKRCFIKTDRNNETEIKDADIQKVLNHCPRDSSIYVELPASSAQSELLRKTLSINRDIVLTKTAEESNYALFGRVGVNDQPAYGFRKTFISVSDSLESMPLETDCFVWHASDVKAGTHVPDSLADRARKLSKLRGWIHLAQPDGACQLFNYHLEICRQNGQVIGNQSYKIGDNITISLAVDNGIDAATISGSKMFVYVFIIDQEGRMTLLYPLDGNAGNRFPIFNGKSLLQRVELLSTEVSLPTGTDHFFVLACKDPVQNPDIVFNQVGVSSGVLSRGEGDASNPLLPLLYMGNHGQRGQPATLPANWSLRKYSFKCTY